MKTWKTRSILAVIAVAACLAVPAQAAVSGPEAPVSNSFIAPDIGGTAALPAIGSVYVSPADIHAWLRAGHELTAEMRASHGLFGNIITGPGGILQGEIETFDSDLIFDITGVGPLKGWSTQVVIPTKVETHTGPRKLGEPVQSFETNMMRVEGQIKGHKDFEYLEVVGGTANGLESPGQTTLYRQKDGNWLVESSFNVKFQLRYKGARGSKLEGLEGSSEGVITMTAVPAPRG
ncbi:MAG TPA: hypothetical protein VEL74_02910 [Thermoanaerobaculia bacterium]|nr:hypothetical protein [Thermoanaerobaculia bacterium]